MIPQCLSSTPDAEVLWIEWATAYKVFSVRSYIQETPAILVIITITINIRHAFASSARSHFSLDIGVSQNVCK